jgi:hypothetical protein
MTATRGFAVLLAIAACGGASLAQAPATGARPTVSELEDRFAGLAEKKLVMAADAMPAEKYDFVPTAGEFRGVRSFGEMIKHVAASNYGMAAAILREKPPIKLETDSDLDAFKTKAEIMSFLKGSFAYLHKAFKTIDERNETELIQSPDSEKPLSRLEVADRAIWHCNDHYGQMVEYLRMNGIVPPASRG